MNNDNQAEVFGIPLIHKEGTPVTEQEFADAVFGPRAIGVSREEAPEIYRVLEQMEKEQLTNEGERGE